MLQLCKTTLECKINSNAIRQEIKQNILFMILEKGSMFWHFPGTTDITIITQNIWLIINIVLLTKADVWKHKHALIRKDWEKLYSSLNKRKLYLIETRPTRANPVQTGMLWKGFIFIIPDQVLFQNLKKIEKREKRSRKGITLIFTNSKWQHFKIPAGLKMKKKRINK